MYICKDTWELLLGMQGGSEGPLAGAATFLHRKPQELTARSMSTQQVVGGPQGQVTLPGGKTEVPRLEKTHLQNDRFRSRQAGESTWGLGWPSTRSFPGPLSITSDKIAMDEFSLLSLGQKTWNSRIQKGMYSSPFFLMVNERLQVRAC